MTNKEKDRQTNRKKDKYSQIYIKTATNIQKMDRESAICHFFFIKEDDFTSKDKKIKDLPKIILYTAVLLRFMSK